MYPSPDISILFASVRVIACTLLTSAAVLLDSFKAGDQGETNLQDPPNHSQQTRLTMAKTSIDLFPFLKQRKADISPGSLYRDNLAISADDLYGSRQFSAETHSDFQRERKEDI